LKLCMKMGCLKSKSGRLFLSEDRWVSGYSEMAISEFSSPIRAENINLNLRRGGL